MRKRIGLLAVALFALGLPSPALGQGCGGFRVLVFSKTRGFRHGAQITAGLALIRGLGVANGFAVDATEDAAKFTASNLRQYASVVFLNTTGDVLDRSQELAFEGFIREGGGFVGVHSATDTEYGWSFYGTLVGAYFASHPSVQSAQLDTVDRTHVSTAHLPARFSHTDEWYNFRTNPASNPKIKVLLTIDERTYRGGTMGSVHPIAWYQEGIGRGRSWYTAMGHTLSTYTATFFSKHLLGGILFASGAIRQTKITSVASYGAGSGAPVLGLAARLGQSQVTLSVGSGSANAAGMLFVSTCSAAARVGTFTLLVDLLPNHLLAAVPMFLDAAGRTQLALPVQLPLPAAVGTSLFVQGAQIVPTIGLSNGVRLTLTP